MSTKENDKNFTRSLNSVAVNMLVLQSYNLVIGEERKENLQNTTNTGSKRAYQLKYLLLRFEK